MHRILKLSGTPLHHYSTRSLFVGFKDYGDVKISEKRACYVNSLIIFPEVSINYNNILCNFFAYLRIS